MLHRVKKQNDIHEGKWNGLGGKVKEDESPKECVIREIYEESGLKLNSVKFVGFLTFPKFDKEKNNWQVFVYVSDDFSEELIDSNEGNLEWIEDDKLFDLNIWEGDKLFFEWIKEEKVFFAKLIYKDSKFVDYEVDFL